MTYCSMKEGETCSADAMLSKPCAVSSGGSKLGAVDVDQQQIADRVFVLLAIQPMQHDLIGDVRLTCEACRANLRATRPASRLPCASGCLAPGGGMTRPRSLRTAFSKQFGILGDARGRDAFEADAAGLGVVVVAARRSTA